MLPLLSCLIRDLRCVASEVKNRTHTLIAVRYLKTDWDSNPSHRGKHPAPYAQSQSQQTN